MPAVLTHKTIMLLARERLRGIRDVLRAKLARPVDRTDLEHRIAHLADTAFTLMSSNALLDDNVIFPTGAAYPLPLGRGVSPFAVMGSMGPDITAFSGLFAPGQAWVFDTIHKGNPDGNREPIRAGTSDFVLEFWKAVEAERAANRATDADLTSLRAYALGHLCHIAGDVISHPYINDLEWHQGNRSRPKMDHAGGEGIIDARVAQKVLLRNSTRQGQDWDRWWPTMKDVPKAFFPAYVEALESTYHARSARPVGFGRFEEAFVERQPPALDEGFIRDGYQMYRGGIVSMGYDYGYGSWFAFLIPLMLPLFAVPFLTGALPHSREFFTKKPWEVGERGWYELIGLPAACSTLAPIIYGIWIATLTTRGVVGTTVAGQVFAWLGLIAAVFFFSTVGVSDADLPPWVRWLFILGFLLVPQFILTAMGADDRVRVDQGGNRGALRLIYGMPFLTTVAFLVVFAFFALLLPKIFGDDTATAFWWVAQIVFAVGILLAWFLLPWKMRDGKIPENADVGFADRRHFVRLFDDTTLAHLPTLPNPSAAELYYPAGRRPLLKLWWDGPGDLYIRSEQRRLLFSFTGEGAPAQVVAAPITPMTALEYGEFLHETVVGPGGEQHKLLMALAYPGDAAKDHWLPTGATFSEEASGEQEAEGVPAEVLSYKKLGTNEGGAYVLLHADKAYQAIRFGRRGPVESITPEDENTAGPGKLGSGGTHVVGVGTAFTYLFEPGDRIFAKDEARLVVTIESDTSLHVDRAFSSNLANDSYARMGPHEEARDGFTYVAKTMVGPGEGSDNTVMDLAADVAAMLCMGLVPHLSAPARTVGTLSGAVAASDGSAIDASVGKVYQVFRNWSLDRRRLNEWRMLIAGGARSEKAAPNEYDAAMPLPRPAAADWSPANVVAAGEPISNAQGWVPTLRQWLGRVATGSAANAAAPPEGGPSNLELSQAMAFLFDLKPPVVLR